MSKLFNHPEALLNTVTRIALEAGEITLKYYDEAGYQGAEIKGDGSPVTKADKEAEAYIVGELQKISKDVPIVGEESYHLLKDVDLSGRFWLVDPLDGTKEFVAGGEDYTVNIALIENGEPVLGIIAAPVLGEVYMGHRDLGARRWLEDTDNSKEMRVRDVPPAGYTAIVSRSRGNTPEMEQFLDQFKISKRISRGSSLKICAVADGRADIYPGLGLTCEWDLAAGHAILKAAGGNIFTLDGEQISYGHINRKFLNPNFIASKEYPFE
jgi:3'(2'), 5'-bisphosphate nucleotidase